ncbi:hypothetical protein NUW54_g12688 [Trametes sanguinea]|uniref:Uncharacterized protein n=1 Tax=Trametes sanguinea TaxID=158606 RepID=A0ACC1MUY9_9APHY|nr:hypothetical protein NUW54_g12688 [Trametes sanguinea]
MGPGHLAGGLGNGTPSSFTSNSGLGARVEDMLSPSNASAAFLPGLHHYINAKNQRPAMGSGLSSMYPGPGSNLATHTMSTSANAYWGLEWRGDVSSTSEYLRDPSTVRSSTQRQLPPAPWASSRSPSDPWWRAAHAPGQSLPQGLAAGYSRITVRRERRRRWYRREATEREERAERGRERERQRGGRMAGDGTPFSSKQASESMVGLGLAGGWGERGGERVTQPSGRDPGEHRPGEGGGVIPAGGESEELGELYPETVTPVAVGHLGMSFRPCTVRYESHNVIFHALEPSTVHMSVGSLDWDLTRAPGHGIGTASRVGRALSRLAAKRRAEEEEKMARARRQEARLKKEEEERAKRERAREQRRKEREEREAKIARARERAAQRAESKDVDTSAARSTTTPTVNGTQASSSVQPSRVVTPNGVRSPDWVLDCEICHKQGVNMVRHISLSTLPRSVYSR